MSEFEITIDRKEYKGQLITFGYSYKIIFFLDDIPVVFEPDEERNFRAIVPLEQMNQIKPELLRSIAKELQISLKQ